MFIINIKTVRKNFYLHIKKCYLQINKFNASYFVSIKIIIIVLLIYHSGIIILVNTKILFPILIYISNPHIV